jgi:hypothetical protein
MRTLGISVDGRRFLGAMIRGTALMLALALATAACSSGDSTTSPITSPTATVTTENFTGSVEVGSSDSHSFTVALSGGQLNATLTAAGPPATIFMGLGIGSFSSSTCTLLSGGSVLAQAGAIAQLTGTVNAGSYCVMVSDAGNQVAPVTYAVTVTHY